MDIDTGVTVIVDMVPLAVAVTAAPTKFNLDTVFAVPINVPSSNIVIPFTDDLMKECYMRKNYFINWRVITQQSTKKISNYWRRIYRFGDGFSLAKTWI